MIPADDELHAARRRVMNLLLDGAIPRGATYQVVVAGRTALVDVAVEDVRGSVTARWP